MIRRIIYLVLLAGICLVPVGVTADIYTYLDSEGVLHFTNVPTSSDYRLFIREKPKKKPVRPDSKAYDHIIQKAQKKFGVDFSLIKAVIHVESGFDPKAISRAGAKGLMQIMPFNFRTLYVKDPFDPEDNIMGGTRYLLKMLRRYEYKLPLALAAYNAGPDAVDRYRRIPPYTETRDYVKKVMEMYHQYQKI